MVRRWKRNRVNDVIVAITRCYNESLNMIHRFCRGYGFADKIIISDGGSTNGARETLERLLIHNSSQVEILDFEEHVVIGGYRWNPDNPHINFIIDKAKSYNPDWIILDDMDDVPNYLLRDDAEDILNICKEPQINAFRLYMWGDKQFYPKMNNNFDPTYTSLWAWKPSELDVHADNNIQHGTIVGLSENPKRLDLPYCLLHKSWNPETIDAKRERYNTIGLTMLPLSHFAGEPENLPDYAVEELEEQDERFSVL